MTVRLTIVVPTYNGADTISATLDSLLKQSFEGIEIIVVDDGSTDETVAKAREHPTRPTVVEQQNCGVAVARNRGLARASGGWIAFLDQDDLWHANRAEQLLTVAESTSARAVASTEQGFALESDRAPLLALGDGRHLMVSRWIADGAESDLVVGESAVSGTGSVKKIDLARLLQGPATVTTSFIYDREAAISAGGCAPHIKAADDYILNLNFTRIFGPIVQLDQNSLFYRVHSRSASNTSPLAAPVLTSHIAYRHGRTVGSEKISSDYLDHLVSNLSLSGLSPLDQIAILQLAHPLGAASRRGLGLLKRQLIMRLRSSRYPATMSNVVASPAPANVGDNGRRVR